MSERDEPDGREAPGETTGDGPPPFGGSWGRLYALVLANLVFLIVLFYLFTKAFR